MADIHSGKECAIECIDVVPSTDNVNFTLTERERRNALRLIDLRVTVVTGIMFCISLMDRTNLGIALIAG